LILASPITQLYYDHTLFNFQYDFPDFDDSVQVPFNLIIKVRPKEHYMNMGKYFNNEISRLTSKRECVCLNQNLYGLLGKVKFVDREHQTVKVQLNTKQELGKVHHPYVGHTAIQSVKFVHSEQLRRYFTEDQISKELRLKYGVISQITSSFLVSFIDRSTFERQVVDLGLNIKNFSKKVHIPDLVRCVDVPIQPEYDDYEYSTHARGAKHMRKQWEFSQECVDIIKQYFMRFPEVFECIQNNKKNSKPITPVIRSDLIVIGSNPFRKRQ